jgi:hypothetical protein
VGGTVWVINGLTGLDDPVGSPGFYVAEAVWIPVHLMVLLGLIGLISSHVVGDLRWGRAAFIVAAVARAIFVVAEIAAILIADDQIFLFPVSAVLTGVSMIVGGVAVVRARRWRGWGRFAPLAVGIYPFVAMFPILAITGSRPNLGVSLWGLTIIAVGLAMAREISWDPTSTPTAVEPSVSG